MIEQRLDHVYAFVRRLNRTHQRRQPPPILRVHLGAMVQQQHDLLKIFRQHQGRVAIFVALFYVYTCTSKDVSQLFKRAIADDMQEVHTFAILQPIMVVSGTADYTILPDCSGRAQRAAAFERSWRGAGFTAWSPRALGVRICRWMERGALTVNQPTACTS
jgi:hypothetical protein